MQNNTGSFKHIGIAGIGLIGGSFAKAFNKQGIKVYGFDLSKETINLSGFSGVFEAVTDDFNSFISLPLDLIYICLPVKAATEFVKQLGDSGVKVPVTDSGSTKSSIIEAAKKADVKFCGGHPIKGKETSGFKNSETTLFKGAKHILTPIGDDNTLAEALKTLHEAIGMDVTIMGGAAHDNILGAVSHLPHFASFCLMDTVNSNNDAAFNFIGGGFRDFTRIAASDPIMWADIFTDNADYILSNIDLFTDNIFKWRKLIEDKDYETLRKEILKISSLRRTL